MATNNDELLAQKRAIKYCVFGAMLQLIDLRLFITIRGADVTQPVHPVHCCTRARAFMTKVVGDCVFTEDERFDTKSLVMICATLAEATALGAHARHERARLGAQLRMRARPLLARAVEIRAAGGAVRCGGSVAWFCKFRLKTRRGRCANLRRLPLPFAALAAAAGERVVVGGCTPCNLSTSSITTLMPSQVSIDVGISADSCRMKPSQSG